MVALHYYFSAMEDNYSTMVALFRSGKEPFQIFEELKYSGVSQSQIYCTVESDQKIP